MSVDEKEADLPITAETLSELNMAENPISFSIPFDALLGRTPDPSQRDVNTRYTPVRIEKHSLSDIHYNPAASQPSFDEIGEYYKLYPDVAAFASKNRLDPSLLQSFMSVVVRQYPHEATCGALYGDPAMMLLWISGEEYTQLEHKKAIEQALAETSEILVGTPYTAHHKQQCVMAAWGRMTELSNARLTAKLKAWSVAQEINAHDESVASGARRSSGSQ